MCAAWGQWPALGGLNFVKLLDVECLFVRDLDHLPQFLLAKIHSAVPGYVMLCAVPWSVSQVILM